MLDFLVVPYVAPAWFCGIALFVLLAVAAYDAFTGYVPPFPLAVLAMLAMAVQISAGNSEDFVTRLFHAIFFYAAIAALIEIWWQVTGQEALGYGDASWSAVAALVFGAAPVVWAWGIGAWLGLLWLGFQRVRGRSGNQLYFLPCLAGGLLIFLLGFSRT